MPEEESQAVVSCLLWVLGIKPRSSTRPVPVHALNHWAVCPMGRFVISLFCLVHVGCVWCRLKAQTLSAPGAFPVSFSPMDGFYFCKAGCGCRFLWQNRAHFVLWPGIAILLLCPLQRFPVVIFRRGFTSSLFGGANSDSIQTHRGSASNHTREDPLLRWHTSKVALSPSLLCPQTVPHGKGHSLLPWLTANPRVGT